MDHSVGDAVVLTPEERRDLESVARYQFGHEAGTALIDAVEEGTHRRSGRVDRLYTSDGRAATLTTDGRFTLGMAGGRAIHGAVSAPDRRVVIDAEARPYARGGETAFAKFVTRVDPRVRPYDEVLIVDDDDDILAVGRASLPASGMITFDRGVAVEIRAGVDE